ncbi:hypothetical protein SANTM175S_01850 [Streptomyces antimycoticus]
MPNAESGDDKPIASAVPRIEERAVIAEADRVQAYACVMTRQCQGIGSAGQRGSQPYAVLGDPADGACAGRREGGGTGGVGLTDMVCRMDLVVQDDQHASAAQLRVGGSKDGRVQIGGSVGPGHDGTAHGASDDDRLLVTMMDVEEERGFLDGVGPLRDHDPVDVASGQGLVDGRAKVC